LTDLICFTDSLMFLLSLNLKMFLITSNHAGEQDHQVLNKHAA